MRKITKRQLTTILAKHKEWLEDKRGGRKANLSEANLSEANLSEANLRGANLRGANLSKTNLSWANLSWANLRGANLRGANLSEANLSEANLSEANLRGANLSEANLIWANLRGANLRGANLSKTNLSWANLSKTNLSEANLSEANLSEANLSEVNIHQTKNLKLPYFPSIRLLSSWRLGTLSDDLTLELMRRDAYAHPKPKLFDEWAKDEDGNCPYDDDTERFWKFNEKRSLWCGGNPEMTDRDLIVCICKEINIEIPN